MKNMSLQPKISSQFLLKLAFLAILSKWVTCAGGDEPKSGPGENPQNPPSSQSPDSSLTETEFSSKLLNDEMYKLYYKDFEKVYEEYKALPNSKVKEYEIFVKKTGGKTSVFSNLRQKLAFRAFAASVLEVHQLARVRHQFTADFQNNHTRELQPK